MKKILLYVLDALLKFGIAVYASAFLTTIIFFISGIDISIFEELFAIYTIVSVAFFYYIIGFSPFLRRLKDEQLSK